MIHGSFDFGKNSNMEVQNNLLERFPQLETPGEASRRLWSLVTKHLTSRPESRDDIGTDSSYVEASIPLALAGRYLMQDGSEFPCRALEISPDGIAIRGVAGGSQGGWVIANFRALGRIEGAMARKSGINFVLDVRATPIALDRLSRKIAWQIRRLRGELPERRRHERVEQNRRKGTLRTDEGRELIGELLDESAGGVAVQLGEAALYLWVGQPVTLDRRAARVLRYFPGGVVLKFGDASEAEFADAG